jgi:isoquinoline 1-oxidoreductase beta subunit
LGAKKGRDALSIEWNHGENENIDSISILDDYSQHAKTKGIVVKEKGHVTTALKKGKKSIDVEFSFPSLAHTPMEPLNCTVKIEDDKCEVWTGVQAPLHRQAEIATFLGL